MFCYSLECFFSLVATKVHKKQQYDELLLEINSYDDFFFSTFINCNEYVDHKPDEKQLLTT
jgi:hypothetical protein